MVSSNISLFVIAALHEGQKGKSIELAASFLILRGTGGQPLELKVVCLGSRGHPYLKSAN